MQIRSKPLISELKTFVAHGVGFGAKSGEHDDLVSAMLLIIRMAGLLADWDPKVFESLSVDSAFSEEWEPPLPIFVSSSI
jgi:hypothetical protein